MIEERFWKIKTAVGGVMTGIGCLCLILAVGALSFGIFMSLKTTIAKPSPTVVITAGKTFKQKVPVPVTGEPVAVIFDETITKEMPKLPKGAKMASLKSGDSLLFSIDLNGGKKNDQNEPIDPSKLTKYTIDKPKMQLWMKSQWRLDDDQAAKYAQFYQAFVDKQPPDLQGAANADLAETGYHYAWVMGIWGLVLVGLGYVLKRFDPDKY